MKSTITNSEHSSQWLFLQRNPEYAKQPASYGMTHQQLEDLRIKQARGEKIEEVPCNLNSNYSIPKHEADHFIVFLLITDFVDNLSSINK
ncbi:MAG: hypothetical protein HC819_01490 [Cyclobacteriaceae bacterium]|nr:hypothetical protein [Cyclobacteriaceae bacterium]